VGGRRWCAERVVDEEVLRVGVEGRYMMETDSVGIITTRHELMACSGLLM
jgi:hypothetical protein